MILRPAPQHLRPAQDGVERRAKLVGERRQEFILDFAHPLGRRCGPRARFRAALALLGRLLRRFVEPRIVDGDARLRRHTDHESLGALGEHVGLRVAEEQPADDLAGTRPHRHRHVAAHRQMPCGHAVVRATSFRNADPCRTSSQRIGRLAAKGRAEQRRRARLSELFECLARRARKRVEQEPVALLRRSCCRRTPRTGRRSTASRRQSPPGPPAAGRASTPGSSRSR